MSVLTSEQERLLHLLAAEHERLRAMPTPEKVVELERPLPGLEPLVGVSAEQVRRSLGEPLSFPRPADESSRTWWYDFARRPRSYRGGGVMLELRFDDGATCIVARWQPQR